MASPWDSLAKLLIRLDKASQSKDLKQCQILMRYLPSLRRTLGLSGAASLYKNIFNQAPDWSQSQDINLPRSSLQSESYLKLITIMILISNSIYTEAKEIISKELSVNLGSVLHPLHARFFYFQAIIQEYQQNLDVKFWFQQYRLASLRHDNYTQATLINIILRFFLLSNKIRQAQQLADKTGFPQLAPYSQIARNQYYLGRINALRLNYLEAHDRLVQAQRKAPENLAAGFKLAVDKLRVLIELLMGQIPTRKTLVGLQGLQAYADLVRSVRSGDLQAYTFCVEKHSDLFLQDMNLSLVERLRHIVIKSGLKRINSAYSAISLSDVSVKLGVNLDDTEFIVAKAIRDGVIKAYIDHQQGVLRSSTVEDKYKTLEPQQMFTKRIGFCMELRNDAVRAMRFPQEEKKKEREDGLLEEIEIAITEEDDF